MDGSRPPFGRLAERAGTGDRAALEALLEALYVPLRRYLLRWLGGRREAWETAQDLTQDSLLRIAHGIGGCRARSDDQVLAWALTVARNRALDHLRTTRRNPLDHSVELDPHETAGRVGDEEDVALPPRLAAWVRITGSLYARLPEETQRILWLRVVQGSSWAAIADEMGMKLRAVQRRFQRFQAAAQRAADRSTRASAPDS